MSERARPVTGRLPGTVWIPASAMLLVIVAVAGAMIGPAGPDWWRVPLALAERTPLLDRLGIDRKGLPWAPDLELGGVQEPRFLATVPPSLGPGALDAITGFWSSDDD